MPELSASRKPPKTPATSPPDRRAAQVKPAGAASPPPPTGEAAGTTSSPLCTEAPQAAVRMPVPVTGSRTNPPVGEPDRERANTCNTASRGAKIPAAERPDSVPEPKTPAGTGLPPQREVADPVPAGRQALSGAEWRKAVKDAQAGNRRKTTRAASKRPTQTAALPPASPGSVPLIATASCAGCEWTAGPGSMTDVDRASDKHVTRGHPVAVSAEIAGLKVGVT